MPTLFRGGPAWGLPDMSPFCIKAETWLRLADIPFDLRSVMPSKAPKGKIPFWREDDGTVVSDSSDILVHLAETRAPLPGDATCPPDRGTGHLVRRTCEEHLYWVILYYRYIDPDGWRIQQEAFAPILPALIGPVILHQVILRKVRNSLDAHGLGRHAPEEVARRGCEDVDALADVLGDQPYFAGDAPGTVDCSAWAMLASLRFAPHDNPVARRVGEHPGLVAFLDRVATEAYGHGFTVGGGPPV